MTPPPLVVRCGHCSQRFLCPLRRRGCSVTCPRCRAVVRIAPDAAPETTMPARPPIDPAAWQAECERAVLALSNLLYAAGRRTTCAALVELLRQMPRSLDARTVPATSLLCRCVREANKAGWPDAERREFTAFARRLTELPAAHRALLEASVIGALLGFNMAS